MSRAMLAALFLVGCGAPTSPGGTADVRVALRGSPDTVRFAIPVVAHSCGGSGGVLLHGARQGLGVLVLLRSEAALDTGTYPLLPRGDSVTRRGAVAAIRFVVSQVVHGLTLSEGSATVLRATAPFDVRARGTGLEASRGQQRSVEFTLNRVPLLSDTVSCRVQL